MLVSQMGMLPWLLLPEIQMAVLRLTSQLCSCSGAHEAEAIALEFQIS